MTDFLLLAAMCEDGCTVGDGITAFAIAFAIVGFFWWLKEL